MIAVQSAVILISKKIPAGMSELLVICEAKLKALMSYLRGKKLCRVNPGDSGPEMDDVGLEGNYAQASSKCFQIRKEGTG
jgi:hypothetical protein